MDVSDLLDEVKPQAPNGLNEFAEDFYKEETGKTIAAARWSRQYDPQSYAQAAKLMPEAPEVGIRQMELLKNYEAVSKFSKIFEDSPQLRGYFAEKPKDLAFANPDDLDNISGLQWLMQAGGAGVEAGYNQYRAADAANRLAEGRGSQADQEIIRKYDGNRTFGARGWFDSGFVGAAQQVVPLALTGLNTARRAFEGSVLFAGAGAAAGAGVGSVVPGPGTAAGAGVGAASGAIFGAQAGAIAGAWEFQQKFQTGMARLYFAQLKDENGQQLEPELQNLAALVTGTGGALLETASMGQFIKTIPGGEKLIGMITAKGMSEALKNQTVRVALTNFAKNLGTTAATEITTEMLQQTLQITAEAAAKANSDGNFEQKTLGEIGEEVFDAGVQAAQVMSILGPLAAGTRFGSDIVEISRSKRQQDELGKITAHLENNELLERNPEIAAKLIDAQTGDKKLYIPAAEALELYQSQGLDLYGPALPNWRNRVDEALRTGGDIETSIGEYVAYLGRNPKENPLAALVRTSPEAYNKAEMAPYEEALNDILSSQIGIATQVNPNAPLAPARPKAVEQFPELEELKKQITSVGFAPKAVEAYSTMLGAFFNTMATRTGKSPSEFFNEFMLSVRRGDIRDMKEGDVTLTDDKRGSITFNTEGEAAINIFDKADLSTMLHESGHFFLDTLSKVKDAAPDLAADWDTVAKKLGNKGEPLTVEQHEQFAKMAEAYFMEGKSPTPELRNAFQAFARWLKTLYRRISQLGGSVSPEIREVFDRMLATEQRIEELVTDTAYAPIFKSAEEMGVSPEDYIAYQRLVEDLREEATVSARERIVGQRERLAKGWRETIQKELRAQAEETLKTQAPYTHMETLKSGKISIDDQSFQKKFSTQSPVVRVGGNSVEFNESARRAFPAKAFKKRGGTDVEVVAELLGYPSADDMVYDFTQAEPIKEASQRMAEQEMALRYGDDFNNSEIMNLAVKQQMAADGRLILLGKELQALKQKAGRGGDLNELGPKQLAVQIARDTIYRKKVGELNETQINASVRRSAAMAEASMVKGKWAEAADWKRKQLLAQALANEVTKVSKTVSKIRDKAARYTRTSPPSVHPSYMEQIRALVEQYEFTKVSDKKLARRASLREFMDGYTDANGNYVPGEKDAGAVFVEIPDRLLRDAGRVNYKELSVEDLIGLGDTLDNLEHLGRVKNKLKKGQELREFNSEKQELITGIKKAPKKVRRTSENYNEKEKGLHRWGAEFMASNLKPEQIISFLDLGDIAGPAMEKIFQPIADAQNAQNTLLLEYNKKLQDVIEGMKPEYLNEPIYVRELGKKFLREEIYVIALNSGSASNFKKLMEGELLNEGEVTNILSHLTKEDWTRIQKIWKTLDGLWGKISALEKRLTGVAPPKIESRQIINEHGTWEGGYYPTVYDFKTQRGKNLLEDTTPADQVLDSQKFFDNKNVLPGTSHKHTVKRTKGGKAPIKLELGVLPSHLHSVIHDLTYREPVRDVRKLLWDPDVKKAITDAQGPEAHTQLQHWLKSVATERPAENDWLSTAVRRVRAGTAIYAMGFRFMTAVAQGLGFFPALTKVSPRYIAHGIYTLAKHPIRSFEFVNGLSMEMRDRFNTQDRDINEISRAPTKSRLDKINSYAFWMIGAMDKGVSTAIWIGAYNEFMTKRGDPRLAVMHADRAVRLSQGTGNIKDMAQVMNQGEISKLFTMFFSAFSAQFNMQVDLTRNTINAIKAGDYGKLLTEYLPQWVYVVVLPSLIGAFITGNGPDDDENEAMWATRKVLLYPFASVPFVRDVVGSVDSGFGYQFSPASRVLDTTTKTIGALFTTKDKDMGERLEAAAKPAATALSILLKYPTGQLINTIEGLWKGLENGDLAPQDLILGRRDK